MLHFWNQHNGMQAKSSPPPVFVWPTSSMFTFLNNWKTKRWLTFHDTWKLHEIQISVSIAKVVLEYSHTHSFTYCLWLLSHITAALRQRPHGLKHMHSQIMWPSTENNLLVFIINDYHIAGLAGKKWHHLKCGCAVALRAPLSLCLGLFWGLWWHGETETKRS